MEKLCCLRFANYKDGVAVVYDMGKKSPNEKTLITMSEGDSLHSVALRYVNDVVGAINVIAVGYCHHDIDIWFVGE